MKPALFLIIFFNLNQADSIFSNTIDKRQRWRRWWWTHSITYAFKRLSSLAASSCSSSASTQLTHATTIRSEHRVSSASSKCCQCDCVAGRRCRKRQWPFTTTTKNRSSSGMCCFFCSFSSFELEIM